MSAVQVDDRDCRWCLFAQVTRTKRVKCARGMWRTRGWEYSYRTVAAFMSFPRTTDAAFCEHFHSMHEKEFER